MVAMDNDKDTPSATDRSKGRDPDSAPTSTKAPARATKATKATEATEVPAKSTKSPAKAAKAARAAKPAKATAKRTRAKAAAKAPATRSAGDAHVTTDGEAAPGPDLRHWRRSRNRALYNRRFQRADEHWPLPTRMATWLFSHPELVLGVLGGREPVEIDGRVLNRSTQALLEVAKRWSTPPDRAGADPVVMRAQLSRMAALAMPVRTDVHVTGRVIRTAGAPTAIPIRIYRQFGSGIGTGRRGSRPPAIVYFHGGGWVTGDLDSHDSSCRQLAAVSGCIVVSVAYRLAPEDPYPAAVEDALGAFAWVQEHSHEVGHLEGQVGVMGDSAGANLAAVVAMRTRSGTGRVSDIPAPVAQGLVYPALDARFESESARTLSDGFLLTVASMEFFRSSYAPDRSQWESGDISPLLADDHRDLAPALVVTAGFDPLRDDGARYAEVLEKAGVEVEYRCYDDQVHGFMAMGILPDSLALATEVCDAMGHLMRRSSAPMAGE